MGAGFVFMAHFLLQPLSLLVLYLLIEGFIRALAATISGKVVGSGILAFLWQVWKKPFAIATAKSTRAATK